MISKFSKVSKCFMSFALAFTLSITAFSPTVLQAFADNTRGNPAPNSTGSNATLGAGAPLDSTSSVDGVFLYDGEQTMDFHWRDAFFYEDSSAYNPSLATMSAEMAWSGFNYVQDHDYSMGYKRLLELTSQCGFSNFVANDAYKTVPGAMTVGVGIAMKTIYINGDANQPRTLITVTQRSGGYGSEWSSNTTLGTEGEAAGFAEGRDEVVWRLLKYLEKYESQIGSNPKIWISGYSRGSAIGNLTGNFIDVAIQEGSDSSHPLMNHKYMADMQAAVSKFGIQTQDVYSYGIEVPKGGVEECAARNTDNLHVCMDPNDAVPYVAPAENWNFQWYGKIHDITVHTAETVRDDLKNNSEVNNLHGADRTSNLYVEELAKIDAGEASAFKESNMHQPFEARRAKDTLALIIGFMDEWKTVDGKDNYVGDTFEGFFGTLMTRMTEACGERADYNEGLQKTAAVLSKVLMNSETGDKAMSATIDAVANRFVSNLGMWLMGTASSVSSTWKTTEKIGLWIAYIASIGSSPNPKLVEDQIEQSREVVCSTMKAAYKELYEARIINEFDYDDLTSSIDMVYPFLIKFIAEDNEKDYQVLTTALTYKGGLVTFHMPPYVTAHLRMNDPLYSTSSDEGYRLDVFPADVTSNLSPYPVTKYSEYVAVDVIGVKGEVRTPLAKIRNGQIAYYDTCPENLKGCIVASAAETGMITVYVKNSGAFKSSFDKAEFEVSAIQEEKVFVDEKDAISLNLSYDYYAPGDAGRVTQDLEKGFVKFLNGDRLVMTCVPGNNAFADSWYYRVNPIYVDENFVAIGGDVSIEKVFLASNGEGTTADINCLPGDRNAILKGVSVPLGDYATCELTYGPSGNDNSKYSRLPGYGADPVCGESVSGAIKPGHHPNSMNLYVVCRNDIPKLYFRTIQSETDSDGKIKTTVLGTTDGSDDSSSFDGITVNGSKTGNINLSHARNGEWVYPGERISITIRKQSGNSQRYGTFTYNGTSYRVEGWQVDELNKDLHPVLTPENEGRQYFDDGMPGSHPGTYTRISFVMPPNDVHLDSVLRSMSDDASLFSFAGSLKITDASGNEVDPAAVGLVPVSSDSTADGKEATDSALKTYKITDHADPSVFPVDIYITAPDLPSSGAEEYEFDHWALYTDSDASNEEFKFNDTGIPHYRYTYEGSTPNIQNKDEEKRIHLDSSFDLPDRIGSLRIAPVYKELGFKVTVMDPWGGQTETLNTSIPHGSVALLDCELPEGHREGSFISGIEGVYTPVRTDSVQSFTDFAFIPNSGTILAETCQSGSAIVTIPKGDVTLKIKTSHSVYAKVNGGEPLLVGTFEAGSTPSGIAISMPVGQVIDDVWSDEAIASCGEDGRTVAIGEMPTSPVTVNVTTKAPEVPTPTQNLTVKGGTVYIGGNEDTALGADATYALNRYVPVKIVPVPAPGQVYDNWNVTLSDGSPMAVSLEKDGTLYFGMPSCDVTVEAVFKSDDDPDPEPDPGPNLDPKPDPEPDPEPNLDPKPDLEPDSRPGPDPDSSSSPNSVPGPPPNNSDSNAGGGSTAGTGDGMLQVAFGAACVAIFAAVVALGTLALSRRRKR